MASTDSQDRAGDVAWQDRWANKRIGFHKQQCNPMLVKHVDKLIAGRQGCRIFFPLCGKAVDMKWLTDMGHTVVGVEFCEIPIREFFKEHNIEYDVLPVEGSAEAKLYKSKDGKLQLYQSNLFNLTREVLGQFDCIYDRGSLIALAKKDRQRYVDLVIPLMKADCKYLLEIVDYDSSKMKGPPFDVQYSVLEELYGEQCNLTAVEKDLDNMNERFKARGLDWMNSSWYMLTLR